MKNVRASQEGPTRRPSRRATPSSIAPCKKALECRESRAARLLAIDDQVSELVAKLRERGFENPYLRNFVVARLRPFRPRGKAAPDADVLLEHMEGAAAKFDASKIKSEQVARTAPSNDDSN